MQRRPVLSNIYTGNNNQNGTDGHHGADMKDSL